jgi:hypothetical protein
MRTSAPLGAVQEAELPGIIARMKERLDREVPRREAAELWSAIYILIGVRYEQALIRALLQGVVAMKESVTYQAILREGRAEGLTMGKVQEARRILLLLGSNRSGVHGDARAGASAIAEVRGVDHGAGRIQLGRERPVAGGLERARGGRQRTGADLAGDVDIARTIHGGGIDAGSITVGVQEQRGGEVAEGRGDGPVFQQFEEGTAEGGPAAWGGPRGDLAGQGEPQRHECRPHGAISCMGGGLRYNGARAAPGAQTERPGAARPVRALLGGETSPAAFCSSGPFAFPFVRSGSRRLSLFPRRSSLCPRSSKRTPPAR